MTPHSRIAVALDAGELPPPAFSNCSAPLCTAMSRRRRRPRSSSGRRRRALERLIGAPQYSSSARLSTRRPACPLGRPVPPFPAADDTAAARGPAVAKNVARTHRTSSPELASVSNHDGGRIVICPESLIRAPAIGSCRMLRAQAPSGRAFPARRDGSPSAAELACERSLT